MSKALLLIDYENEWVDPKSEYFVGDISPVLDRTNRLIRYCRSNGYKIIFTTHIEETSTGAFAEGSENVKIMNSLEKQDGDILVSKNRISPFFKTRLEDELRGVEDLVIAGILTNLCVRSAIQDAYDRDFNITVIKDCCVSMDEATREFTFKDLKETRDEIAFQDLVDFVNS